MVAELHARHVIHLHRLFAVIANDLGEQGMPDERLSDYRDHEVLSMDFHATKADHEAALMELADTVSEWASEEMESDEDRSRVEVAAGQ